MYLFFGLMRKVDAGFVLIWLLVGIAIEVATYLPLILTGPYLRQPDSLGRPSWLEQLVPFSWLPSWRGSEAGRRSFPRGSNGLE
jgi:hypothetical protein